MIKIYTACTEEIDDVDAAVSGLFEQLKPDENLLKNSAALVHCHYEFIGSGVVEELTRRLGFPVVGTTTMALGLSGFLGEMGLSLTVLTSNDVRFSSGISDPVDSCEISKPVTDLYRKVSEGFDEKPSLVFTFPPLLKGEGQGGDVFVAELDKACGGDVPLFGTLPVTNEIDERMSLVLYGGKTYESSMALLACYGDLKPEFYTVAITEKALQAKRAKITGEKLNGIESINNMPAEKYLETLGLSVSSLACMPIVIYQEDGSKIFRVGIKIIDNGSLMITGTVPGNAEVSFSLINDKDIVASTEKLLEDIIKNKSTEGRGLLIYACASRFWLLGSQWETEPGKAVSIIKDTVPWHFVYSGGEVFPSILANGKVANNLQNYSVIVCML
ncbi:MAG: FIST C-terminal domain-containing protein [Spirochaetaceae bacterium]|jgi:hypothetical protein|nr:FIST C-terminal domain-containing protein [Spirochaetaceae bacterium]